VLERHAEIRIRKFGTEPGEAIPRGAGRVFDQTPQQGRTDGIVEQMNEERTGSVSQTAEIGQRLQHRNGTVFVPLGPFGAERTVVPVAAAGCRIGKDESWSQIFPKRQGTVIRCNVAAGFPGGAGQGKQELVWVARDRKAQSVDPDWQGDNLWAPTFSPDGKRLAVARFDRLRTDIWIKQLERGTSIKLTSEGRGNFFPTWTPDGQYVTFTSIDSGGSTSLWTKRADANAQAVLQYRGNGGANAARWSPDRKWFIFETTLEGPDSGDILGVRPGIDTVAVPLVVSKFTEASPALSPDGQWLAYSSNESGQNEIYVVPFPNTRATRSVVSTRGGTEPLWSHRGSELFYRDGAGYLVAVEVKTNPTLSLGRSTALFPAAGFESLVWAPEYAVAPDDQRFLMVRPVADSTGDRLIVVDNWFDEMKSRK
jgi:hypothetical protein